MEHSTLDYSAVVRKLRKHELKFSVRAPVVIHLTFQSLVVNLCTNTRLSQVYHLKILSSAQRVHLTALYDSTNKQ